MKRIINWAIIFIIFVGLTILMLKSGSGDPTGVTKQTVAEIGDELTLNSVGEAVAQTKIGLNYVWMLLCGCLIFFFQAGFAMVEAGFTRAKNANHTMAMNLIVFLVGMIGFLAIGFAIMFGGVGDIAALGGSTNLTNELSIGGWGILGYKGFLLTGVAYDVGICIFFFFQAVFMDTACTIPTGSMAERVKLSAIIANTVFISTIYYPLFGNWVWGGGWLAQLGVNAGLGHGVVDFAGSSVVHAMGGAAALAGAMIIGPRIGKFKKNGKSNVIPGHHIPMAVIGTIILFFGWFAFNAGSTLSGSDLRSGIVATNTMIAGAVGGVVALAYMWKKFGKPDTSMTCNGALAGLVAITAPCAFVNPVAAVIIGGVAGLLVCIAVQIFENKFKIDDPVGASSVHLVNGLWGMIALGLFADGTYGDGLNGVSGAVTGLFYGDSGQLVAQLIAVAVVLVFGIGSQLIFWKITDKTIGIRVKPEDEIEGLDVPEMGAKAYPDFEYNVDGGVKIK